MNYSMAAVRYVRSKGKVIFPLTLILIFPFSTDLFACGACQDLWVSFYLPFSSQWVGILAIWLLAGILFQALSKLYKFRSKENSKFPLNYMRYSGVLILVWLLGSSLMSGIVLPSLCMVCYLTFRSAQHIIKKLKAQEPMRIHEKSLMVFNGLFILALVAVVPVNYIDYHDTSKLIGKLDHSPRGPTRHIMNALANKGEEVVPDLMSVLSEGQDKHSEQVLINVISILEEFKDERSIPHLKNVLITIKYHGDHRDSLVDKLLIKTGRLLFSLDPSSIEMLPALPPKIREELESRLD